MKKSYFFVIGAIFMFCCCNSTSKENERLRQESEQYGKELKHTVDDATGRNSTLKDIK